MIDIPVNPEFVADLLLVDTSSGAVVRKLPALGWALGLNSAAPPEGGSPAARLATLQ